MAVSSSRKRKLKDEEKQEERKIEENEDEEEETAVKWANHYSSIQQILLVGDGDFSFSLSLANTFGSATNMVCTSWDSHDTLLKKYTDAESNFKKLKEKGATILHNVDATKMKFHTDLTMRKFDRIIFNFPHAGFKGKEHNMRLINLHRELVNGFFKNASQMLRPYGEVHVTHKIGDPFDKWNIEELAHRNLLILTECATFNIQDYPGYNNKRGDSHRSDEPFPLGDCRTFMFRIGDVHRKKRAERMMPICVRPSRETMVANPDGLEIFRIDHWPSAVHPYEGCRRSVLSNTEHVPSSVHCSPAHGISNAYSRETRSYDMGQAYGNVRQYLTGASFNGHERYATGAPWNTELRFLDCWPRELHGPCFSGPILRRDSVLWGWESERQRGCNDFGDKGLASTLTSTMQNKGLW